MDKKQALNKAMALCARQEYCEYDIRGKLKTWGIGEGDGDAIIQELTRQKFIDDLRFSVAFVQDKVRLNQWGRIKIRYMLSSRKIAGSIMDQALDRIDGNLYTQTLREMLQKKDRFLATEMNPRIRREKLIRFGMGRGFEMDEILKILKTD